MGGQVKKKKDAGTQLKTLAQPSGTTVGEGQVIFSHLNANGLFEKNIGKTHTRTTLLGRS